MQSKASKLRGQLASVAQEREQFEKQKKELEAQMSKGKNNMDKISKGLKGNELSGTLVELEADEFGSPKPKSKLGSSGRINRNESLKSGGNTTNPSPLKTSSIHIMKSLPSTSSVESGIISSRISSMRQTVIMPGYSRVSDWCYTGLLESAPPSVKTNDVYEFVRWLGRGSFGDVQLVKSMEEKQLYAMKTIFSEHDSEYQKSLREVVFLRTYRHPYVIDILDSFCTQQPKILHIVMHYCEGGDLGKLIIAAKKNSSSISEHQIIKWSIQLALALHFLHENHIVHRDLKPSNALLTDGGETVKLADLGLTIELQNNLCEKATEAGTPLYSAPEMINGEKYSYPIDCWAFGVMLHELITLDPPFYKSDTTELVKSILNDDPPVLPGNYSSDLKTICHLFLAKNPNNRLGFAAMLSDPFISSKVQTIPSSYRPKSLEERIRRAHVKQLQAQIESLPLSELSSAIAVPELVRLNDLEREEKYAAAAALAEAQVLATMTEGEGENGNGNDISMHGRSRGSLPGLMMRKPSMRKQSFNLTNESRPTSSQHSGSMNDSTSAIVEIDAINTTSILSAMVLQPMEVKESVEEGEEGFDSENDKENGEEEEDASTNRSVLPSTKNMDDMKGILFDGVDVNAETIESTNELKVSLAELSSVSSNHLDTTLIDKDKDISCNSHNYSSSSGNTTTGEASTARTESPSVSTVNDPILLSDSIATIRSIDSNQIEHQIEHQIEYQIEQNIEKESDQNEDLSVPRQVSGGRIGLAIAEAQSMDQELSNLATT